MGSGSGDDSRVTVSGTDGRIKGGSAVALVRAVAYGHAVGARTGKGDLIIVVTAGDRIAAAASQRDGVGVGAAARAVHGHLACAGPSRARGDHTTSPLCRHAVAAGPQRHIQVCPAADRHGVIATSGRDGVAGTVT